MTENERVTERERERGGGGEGGVWQGEKGMIMQQTYI